MGVTLVLGPERFLAREAARAALASGDLDVVRHGADARLADVLDDLRTPSLLGGRRGALVDPADNLVTGDALAALADYAEDPVPGTRLVLVASSVDGRTKAGKRLKTAAEVVECRPPPAQKVPAWVADRARRVHGLKMGSDVAQLLYQRVGDDLGLLDAALRRLKDHVAPRDRVESDDVATSTAAHRSPIVFEVANALEERDLPRALGSLAAAFHEGIRVNQDVVADAPAVAPILLTNLHRAWVKLLRFHLTHRRGESPEATARSIGVSPQATRFFLKKTRKWSADELVDRHKLFLQADLELKRRTASGSRPVLERLLLGLLR